MTTQTDASQPDFSAVFLSEQRIAAIKAAVDQKENPTHLAFETMLETIQPEIDRQPTVPTEWHVPGYYHDPEGHKKAKNGLRDDANIAYGLALASRITDNDTYAQSAIRLIDGWISGIDSMSIKADSTLSFSYHFPAFIFAASLLRDQTIWSDALEDRFSTFLREKALPMNTMDKTNNWGNWGLVLAVSCASYLKDRALFEICAERWKFFIIHQIAEEGHLPHEVTRNEGRHGLWYSHFCLMPQTIAAEILAVNGADLYDYTSPDGKSLQFAYEKLIPWVAEPETFHYWKGDPEDLAAPDYISYWEILNQHWANSQAEELLKAKRPMSASHSAPYLTLTHGK